MSVLSKPKSKSKEEKPPQSAVADILSRPMAEINREINRGFAKCAGARSFLDFINCVDAVFAANPVLRGAAQGLVLKSLAEMGIRFRNWEELKRRAREVPYLYYAMIVGAGPQAQSRPTTGGLVI